MSTDATYDDDEIASFCRRMVEHPIHRALGVELLARDATHAVCRLPVDEAKDGGGGYLHGGFVSMAVEVAAFFVAIGAARRGQWPATLDLHVALLRSARIGSTLETRASLLSRTRSVAVVRVDVVELRTDGTTATVAGATVTKAYRDVARS